MGKDELYRQVFLSFKQLCAEGRQPSSFRAFCRSNSVDQSQMRQVLKSEFQNIKTLPGYCCVNSRLYKREFGIRNAIKKLNRQLEKVVGSFGNFADI